MPLGLAVVNDLSISALHPVLIVVKELGTRHAFLLFIIYLGTCCDYIVLLAQDPKHLVLMSQLNDVNIYSANNAKKKLGAPNNYCFCLKVSDVINGSALADHLLVLN